MFERLRYVYEVYRERSFSKAAANLYISQPSLSAAVKKEEEELGFPIFDRTTSPIRLTELGREYIRTGEQIMASENNFRNYLDDISTLNVGSLSIGGTNLYASYVLPPILAKFTECFPAIHVDLKEGVGSALVEELSAGTLDLLIENRELDNLQFEKSFYCREEILLAVPRRLIADSKLYSLSLSADDIQSSLHTRADCPTVSLEAFQDAPFVLLRTGNNTRDHADRICRDHNFTPNIKLEVAQQVTSYHYACHGMGIVFIGDLLIKRVRPDQSLVFFKLSGTKASRDVNFYYRRNRYLPHALRALIAMISENAENEKGQNA